MRELYLRRAGELERGAFRLGVILAALHRSRRPKGLEDAPRLVWSLTSVTPEALATMTAASLEYIAKLQESDPLIDSLEALQGEETPAAVIHRDVTLLNVIVPSSRDVVLVDWELAGIGDPAVDLATPVADALSLWLITSRRERRSLTCDLAGWQCWRSFARALMEGYGGHAGIHKAKIGSFAGAYLLTRGLAITEARGRLSGDAQVLAHVGQRLVLEPMRLWRLVGGSSSGGGG
jgi:aminoglycoside phosphotransferase (APT) family kinase protein